ncbi:hypothetical protein Q3C01_17490 [Bradyrhizobium sp. UFLA05-109]
MNLAVKDAARRYNPPEVAAVEREVVSGIPAYISTIYVERQNLTLRMTQHRFAGLTNGFSKKLTTSLRRLVCTSPTTISAASMWRCGLGEPALALGIVWIASGRLRI